jgi:hypothetical protein
LKRRDPRRFDFGRPFGGEVRIEHARLHEPSTGRTFFQAATLDALARAVDPRTGDVLLRAVELDAPELQAVQTDAGLELLGVRLLPPPAAAAGAATAAAAAAAAPTAAAAPELRLDRLRVHGLALRYDDLRTTPATVLPVLDGEFEIEHFTTRPRGTTRPLSFRGSVRGGEVPLEQRILRSSVVAGLLQSAAGAIVGRDDSHAIELRPCFDEIRLQGELTQREPSRGELELTISAFELPALRGLGKRGGVDIADGILDQRLRLALRGDDGVLVRSSSVFTWLSLSEPPGGPISTYLRLPAPLDTVLFVLRNDADEHRIPLQLEVRGPGMRGSDVLDLVVKTLANVLGDAARGALGRTTSALSGALGLGAASGGPRPLVAELACAAGDAPQCAFDPALLAAIAADPKLELVLSHELGAGDLPRAAALANPAPAVVQTTVARRQHQRTELLAARAPLADELLALYAAGKRQDAVARQAALQQLDQQLGELEHGLDQALDQLDRDDARARSRRTQTAAIGLGQQRLDHAAAALQRAIPGLSSDRIVRRPPRAIAVAGRPAGGAVVLVARRRSPD